jgi:hypothetical protein
MPKTYNIGLLGICEKVTIYALEEDARIYWDMNIASDESQIEAYLEGDDTESPIPGEADFLEGETRDQAPCLAREYTIVNLPDCKLVINDGENEEVVDLSSDDHEVTVDWDEEDTEEIDGLVVLERMKGLIFESEIDLNEEFDKSKLKIVLQEETNGDSLIGIFYDGEELEIMDYDLQHKGTTYEIIDTV